LNIMRFLAAGIAACALALSGCGGKQPPLGGSPQVTVIDAAALPAPDGGPATTGRTTYRVGARDRLLVDVVGIDALQKREVETDTSGQLAVPMAGRIDARGLTLAEVEQKIADGLRRNYVRNPQVSVNAVELRSQMMTVDGSVMEPGRFVVSDDMTLIGAIASAKGLSEYAKQEDVVVFRQVQDKQMVALFNLAAIRRGAYGDPRIYPGDKIVVGESASRRLFANVAQAGSLLTAPIIGVINQL
jgi:polysaccharide export outer membrane protein